MFFKTLELNGFKSFASKTTVELKSGITVIVGPNGAGKSNILDAVRWVLGEQSALSLRSQKMEDVLFNGSASVKPVGMAQVSLTLLNEDRELPIDYTEVTIARRLFRTGESEYLLNKVSCRLKDISSLIMDTGIGKNAYSIMEQGKVDEIINAKPLERRYIFDEAAGITKYKTRREEALRKLKRTRDDLLRLTDVISEVRRRMNSLKRQANKAERYKQIAEELKTTEMQLLVLRHDRTNQELTELNKSLIVLKDKHQGMVAQSSKLESLMIEEEQKLDQLNRDISTSFAELNKVTSTIENTNSDIRLLQERIRSDEERKQFLEAACANARQKVEQLRAEKDEVAAEIDRISKRLGELEAEHETKQHEHEDLKVSIGDKTERQTELRNQLASVTSEVLTRKGEMKVAESKSESFSHEIEENSRQIEGLQSTQSVFESRIKDERTEIGKLEQQHEEKQKQFDDVKEKIVLTEEEILELAKQMESSAKDLQEHKSRHDALKRLQEGFEGYFSGVKAVMDQKKAGKLSGIIGVAANLIKTEKQYEPAIEVALGTNIQNVIVESSDDAKVAIEHLKQTGKGRATFLPVDQALPLSLNEEARKALDAEGVIGVADTLVSSSKQVEPVFKCLLGNTIIVDNLETALSLNGKQLAVHIVTLEGDHLNPNGAMTGGSGHTSGLLGRERELGELEKEIPQLESEIGKIDEQLDRKRDDLQDAVGKKDSLFGDIHQAELNLATHTKELEAIENDYKTHKESVANFQEKVASLKKDLDAQNAAVASHNETVGTLAQKEAKLQAELDSLESISTEESSHSDQLGQQVAELLLNITSLRERLRSSQERVTTFGNTISGLNDEMNSHQGEASNMEEGVAKSKSEIEQLREKLSGFAKTRDNCDQTVRTQEKQRDEFESGIREFRSSFQEINRDKNIAQNELYEVQLKKAQLDEKLATIETQTEEKFRISYEQAVESVGEIEAGFEDLMASVNTLRDKIDSMGPVNVIAIDEYNEHKERYEFLTSQEKDLTEAEENLTKTIKTIDETTKKMFQESFEAVRKNFIEMFRKIFNGGKADLVLLDPDNINESGIDIVAQPPGKKLQNINLLSGGEKALTAISLLFAIFLEKPTPFCILDEIDAPLDDMNIGRFKSVLREFSSKVQFIIITHNKQTMELADVIYGVTMEEPGVSKLVSVEFDKIDSEEYAGLIETK